MALRGQVFIIILLKLGLKISLIDHNVYTENIFSCNVIHNERYVHSNRYKLFKQTDQCGTLDYLTHLINAVQILSLMFQV